MGAFLTVLKWFLLFFAALEIVSNGLYLATGNSRTWGRRQHGDLPADASDDQVHAKVVRMLVVGLVALGLLAPALRGGSAWWIVAAACVVAPAAWFDLAVHRFNRTAIAAGVTSVLAIVGAVAAYSA